MICVNSAEIWLHIVELAILIAYMCPAVSSNAVCLKCDSLPHPRDCDRAVQCNANELCYVQQVVTVSGNVVYNSGCASEQKCQTSKTKRSSVLYSKTMNEQSDSFGEDESLHHTSVDEVSVYETAEDDLTTCYQCCNSSNYCNRDVCDHGAPVAHPNQTYCMSCSDVIQPNDCERLVLCNPGEACSKTVSNNGPALVGKKKRFVTDEMSMYKYCSQCCIDAVGNCNRELCDKSGTILPATEVFELVNPPERKDFCADLYPKSCPLLILQDPTLCTVPGYSHYACREYCGTCVNPGHVTSRPLQSSPATTSANSGTNVAVTPTKTTGSQLPATDCFYKSTDYMGAYTTTVTGKTCLKWAELDPAAQGIPDVSVDAAGNKCRDPDGRGFPWCYTSKSYDWEFCPVPYCQECYYQNKSVHYTGYVSKDKDNTTCLPWADYFTQIGLHFNNISYIQGLKNYCRDPNSSGKPQCFTGTSLTDCDIPVCPHECKDDPETNCALIQLYVCQYEYTRVTLCPKTCDRCNFGLLPPRQVDYPEDICVDNPDASCETLKFIICGDPDGAKKLCPKTCGKCNLLYSKTTSNPSTIQTTAAVTTIMTSTTPLSSNSTSVQTTQSILSTTPTTTTTSATQPTTQPPPYWLPWGEWKCEEQNNQCFQRRFRNCSTNSDKDCIDEQGGVRYSISLCTKVSCPEYFTTTTSKTPASTTPLDTCQDDPAAIGCKDNITLVEVCKENAIAWKLCPASCNLCDTCWDYLNCSSPGAQKVFCGRDEYALQYCRQTCGRCSDKPVQVRLNACGDPVANEAICETLQAEICICNDPDVRALCGRYCNNKCDGHPLTGTDCIPARRRKRDAALQRHVFL